MSETYDPTRFSLWASFPVPTTDDQIRNHVLKTFGATDDQIRTQFPVTVSLILTNGTRFWFWDSDAEWQDELSAKEIATKFREGRYSKFTEFHGVQEALPQSQTIAKCLKMTHEQPGQKPIRTYAEFKAAMFNLLPDDMKAEQKAKEEVS